MKIPEEIIHQNLRIEGEKLLYDAYKPFDLMIKADAGNLWRQTLGTLPAVALRLWQTVRTFRWSNLRKTVELIQATKTA